MFKFYINAPLKSTQRNEKRTWLRSKYAYDSLLEVASAMDRTATGTTYGKKELQTWEKQQVAAYREMAESIRTGRTSGITTGGYGWRVAVWKGEELPSARPTGSRAG